jgi:ElaB/YqjD/DUF883 family membrane-anchored ribosome-binding protein
VIESLRRNGTWAGFVRAETIIGAAVSPSPIVAQHGSEEAIGSSAGARKEPASPTRPEHLSRSFVAGCDKKIFEWRLQMTDTSRSDFNQAANKAQKVREDVADKAKAAVDSASSAASQTISRVEEAGKQAWDLGQKYGAQAKDQAQEIAGQVSEQSGRALQAITRQVQAEPLLGILIAGAIGYFLGVIGHRR